MSGFFSTDPWENGNDKRYAGYRTSYSIKAIHNQHHEVIRRSILGQNNHEIAAEIGLGHQQVCNILNSDITRRKINELQRQLYGETLDIAQRIQDFTPEALTLLEEIIEGKHAEASIGLRAKYAALHLARAGYGEIKKAVNLNTHLKREEIEAIKSRSVAAAREAGIIAADYVDKSGE